MIFAAYMPTAIPNYLIMSKLGLMNTWITISFQPATLSLIGSIVIISTNIILLIKKSAQNKK